LWLHDEIARPFCFPAVDTTSTKGEQILMLKEFKEFVMRGNVIDLAVAVIIGAAFGPIVTSLVNDIIMPPIGLVLRRVDFKDMYLGLTSDHYASLSAAKAAGAPVIAYGNFLNTVINFLIVSFAIFMLLREVNRLHKPAPAPAPAAKECPYCYSSIALKATRCPNCTSQLGAP
jgi:large conductance mechanosensitive channel